MQKLDNIKWLKCNGQYSAVRGIKQWEVAHLTD